MSTGHVGVAARTTPHSSRNPQYCPSITTSNEYSDISPYPTGDVLKCRSKARSPRYVYAPPRKCITGTTHVCRVALSVLAALVIVQREQTDDILQNIWTYLRSCRIVQLDTFEPLLSVMAFAVWINGFRLVNKYLPRASVYRIHAPPRSETFIGWGHEVNAGVAYLVPLYLFDVIYPRRVLPVEAPTMWSYLTTVFLTVVAYDFCFFWLHLGMHKIPILAHFHKTHHTNKNQVASEVLRHSLVDGTLQVGTNILVLNLFRAHPLCRLTHNLVVTYMLTETHSGYNFPWMLHNVIPGDILGGSIRHEEHHRSGLVYYHQFFTYLDNALGYVIPIRHTTTASAAGTGDRLTNAAGWDDCDSITSSSDSASDGGSHSTSISSNADSD